MNTILLQIPDVLCERRTALSEQTGSSASWKTYALRNRDLQICEEDVREPVLPGK